MRSNTLTLPDNTTNLLLHSCCAPCAGEIMEALLFSNIPFTIYFYNPNIHPLEEYLLRKDENIRFAKQHNIPFIDGDYNKDDWFKHVDGLGNEPEKGIRCTLCFDMRLEETARYASLHGFDVFCTTLGISRWKNREQIDACGMRSAARTDNVIYWDYNWRKEGGSARMLDISKREGFYQQEYCGCVYSLRDTNHSRLKQGRSRIKRGTQFYQPKEP